MPGRSFAASQHRGARGSRGFTLLEVVVALIIFALVFGALTQILATGFRQSRAAERVIRTTLIAESMLERIGNEFALEPGTFGGEAAPGYRFEAEIEPRGKPDDSLGLVRYRVEVIVFAEEEAPESGVRLRSIRLGAALR
jgi:prepilin-type N-terminal cleavage/methylation domain-containing protein